LTTAKTPRTNDTAMIRGVILERAK